MPNFNTDPNSFGSAFKLRGTTLPGPFRQVATKTGARDVDEVTANEPESYAARPGSPMEQHGSIRSKYKTHGVPGGPGSPMEQKIWQKGGLKKHIWDPLFNWNKETEAVKSTADIAVGTVAAAQTLKGLATVLPTSPNMSGTVLGKAVTAASETTIGKGLIGAATKVIPPALAIAGGYVAGQGIKGVLNWINRGVRNVLVTGERAGTSEFKSQWGLKEGGGIDWKGHKGGAGQGELSKETRKEKGIKIDFK